MLLCFGAGNLDVKMQGPRIATVIYHRRWSIVSADMQAYVCTQEIPGGFGDIERRCTERAAERERVRGLKGRG
jgi:hypothetical protein